MGWGFAGLDCRAALVMTGVSSGGRYLVVSADRCIGDRAGVATGRGVFDDFGTGFGWYCVVAARGGWAASACKIVGYDGVEIRRLSILREIGDRKTLTRHFAKLERKHGIFVRGISTDYVQRWLDCSPTDVEGTDVRRRELLHH